MSETYIVTAKTVEEAVSTANRTYADENHEVSYEILEMPKKGFLGIGAKEAKIKVTVTETKSVELGSLVADIRSMKNLTDRGGDEKKNQPKQQNNQPKQQKQDNNQKNKQSDKQQNNNNNQKNKQNNQNNQKNNNNQKQNNKPQQKQEQKPAEKAVESKPAVEEKPQNKTRLNNQALPGKRSKQKKSTPSESDISASAVTVNTPANLSDFVAEKPAQNTFGSSERSGGGRMSNDIRRGKKPAQGKPVSTETRDRQMLDSKYDVAETDDDYKNLAKLERENENLLEREALTVLGLGDKEEAAPAEPEVRTREAVTEDEMKFALEFANTLLKNMQIGAEAVPMECPEDEELIVTETATVYPKINIVGDDSGILIGHHGETLDSIQYLVNLCALRKTKSKDGDYVKIVVDIENYRNKREDTLRALARRMAAKAVKYKRNVFLEPMNAYERRIIHSELQKFAGVSTHSVGSDRDRKIIITYEGADKAPENKSRRRRNRGKGKSSDNKSDKQNKPAEEITADTAEKKTHHRPRKPQKLTIDKLGDLLDGNETVKLEPADEE